MTPERRIGWIALAVFIVLVAWSPIFVRWSDVGPIASAFWRMVFALPPLLLWSAWGRRPRGRSDHAGEAPAALPPKRFALLTVAAGLCFAADVALFHIALVSTSVANAAFIGNTASLFVVAGGVFLFREALRPRLAAAFLVGLVGVFIMSGASEPLARGGDLYALGAALAYAAYVLVIKAAGQGGRIADTMLGSSLVTALVLGVAALLLEDRFWPPTPASWWPLLALGMLSHALGQGANAVALARLPVAPVQLVTLVQPLLSTALAALWLAEAVSLAQAVGGGLILLALAGLRPGRS